MKQATTTEFEGAATIAVANDKPYAGFWPIEYRPVRQSFPGESITEYYSTKALRDTVFAGLRCARAA